MLTTMHKEISRNTKMLLPLNALAGPEFTMDDDVGKLPTALHPDDLRRNNILASMSAEEIEFLLKGRWHTSK